MRVAAHARVDAASRMDGPLWDKLAAGTLTAAERAALAAQVAGDAELEAAVDVLGSLASDRATRDDAVIARIAASRPAAAPVSGGARVTALRRRAGVLVAGLALAAGVAFAVSRPGGTAGALPPYALEVTGGEQAVRAAGTVSAPAGVVRLGPASRLSIRLRPDRPVSVPVDAKAFLVRGGVEQPWAAPIQVAPSGALQIEGPASLVPGGNGAVDVVVGVGPAHAVGSDVASLERSGYPVFRVHLEVTGR
jgi:hypothetical protein